MNPGPSEVVRARLAGWYRGRAQASRHAARGLAWLALAGLLSALLCSSAFYFGGTKVDESEVVLNALTIATGEWDPEWSPGYGHLAMYLPAFLFWLVAWCLRIFGLAASHGDALYLLFADDAVYRLTRLLYTLADVATALLLAHMIVRVTRQRLIAVLSVAYFLVSPDTWQYANFVRTDTLVSFFTACAVYLLVIDRSRATPYLLGIALGAAIACKYSAAVYVALIGLLLVPVGSPLPGWRDRAKMVVAAGLVTVVATFLFQPLYDYSEIVGAIDKNLRGAHFTKEVMPLPQRLGRLWDLVRANEPFALGWLVLSLGGLLQARRFAPLALAVVLGIAPFALSNFAREYWLLPFADMLRGAGWFGCASIAAWAGRRFGEIPRRALAGLALAAVVAVVGSRWPGLARTHAVSGVSNADIARRWLNLHVANRKPLVYVYERNYLLPRAYSFADYAEAAKLSRVFIFERDGFESLHRLFKRRLYTREYADFSNGTASPALHLSMAARDAAIASPELCVGDRCYRPKPRACSSAARTAFADCAAFSWDMDRALLRKDLSGIELKLAPGVSDFATCWYDCGNTDAEAPVFRKHDGRLPLLAISDRLFASMSVRGLGEIRRLDRTDDETFIVTTPQAYRKWLPARDRGRKDPSGAFAKATNSRLMWYFDAASGPRIEIYVVDGQRRGRQPAR